MQSAHRAYRCTGTALAIASITTSYLLGSAAQAQSKARSWPHMMSIDVFTIHSDFELTQRRQLEATLLHLRGEMRSLLKLPESKATIHVVIFKDPAEYSRYMQHYFPTVAQRRAIFLQDRGPGMLFTHWHDHIDVDLRHEAAHALLNQSGSELPLWLDEGLAEYFELHSDDRYARNPYLSEVVGQAGRALVPSLLMLERIDDLAGFTEPQYRDSWAWIHFLLHRNERTRQILVEFITRAQAKTPQPPLSRQLPAILSDPMFEFQQHFQDMKLRVQDSASRPPTISTDTYTDRWKDGNLVMQASASSESTSLQTASQGASN